MKMEGGNPSVLSKFSSSKRSGSNTMHNFQSLFCAETGAGCGLVRLSAADGPGAFRHTSSCSRNLSGRSPSILLCKTVRSLKSPTGAFLAALRFANASLPVAGGTGSSCKQRKNGSSHWGTPCCTYRYRMWIFQGASYSGAHPVFCFALNLLAHGFQPHSSNISPGHRSESNPHSPTDRCR